MQAAVTGRLYPAAIAGRAGLQQQIAIGLHGAAVAEGGSGRAAGIGNVDIAAGKHGAAIVQRAVDTQGNRAAIRLGSAAIAKTVAGGQVQCIGLQRAGIADCRCVERQRATGLADAALLGAVVAAAAYAQITRRQQLAADVGAAGRHVQCMRRLQRAAVGQCATQADRVCRAAIRGGQQPAAAIVQAGQLQAAVTGRLYPAAIAGRAGLQGQAAIADDVAAAAIAECLTTVAAGIGHIQGGLGMQGATIVQAVARAQGDAAIVGADAAGVIQAITRRQQQIARRAFNALRAIGRRADGTAGTEGDVASGLELGLAQRQIAIACRQLHALRAIQRRTLVADDQAAVAGLPCPAATAPLGAINVATAADGNAKRIASKADIVIALAITAGAVVKAGRAQAQVMTGDDGAATEAGGRLAAQRQVLAGAEAGISQLQIAATAIGGNGHIAGGGQLIVQQDAALGGKGEITAIGRHIAQHAHADTRLGRHQEDAVGVHAAQACRIDGITGRTAGRSHAARDAARAIAPAVGAGIDAEVRYIDLAADADRAADQIENLLSRGIDAAAIDQDIALTDIEARQATIAAQHRQTRAERDAVGIDEATAGARDAIGVGHHHIGLAAQYFGKAGQGAAAAAHHLIENQTGLIAEIDVGVNLTGQLRLAGHLAGIGIVQHQALAVDVVLGVLVVGYPSGIGSGDVHHSGAICGNVAAGIAAGGNGGGRRLCRLSQQTGAQQGQGGGASDCSGTRTTTTGYFGRSHPAVFAGIPDQTIDFVHG